MRALVASDIHGYAHTLEQLLEIYRNGGFDRLYLLGDLLTGRIGASVDKVATAKLLKKYSDDILAVRGNCDGSAIDKALGYDIPDYLQASLYFDNSTKSAFFYHGHNSANKFIANDTDIVCFGHSHIPSIEKYKPYGKDDEMIFLNPGSLAFPRGVYPQTYGIIDEFGVEIKSLGGVTLARELW